MAKKSIASALRKRSRRNDVASLRRLISKEDKEVAIAKINQFPEYAETLRTCITEFQTTCDKAIATGSEETKIAMTACKNAMDSLCDRLNNENITQEERTAISSDFVTIATQLNEIDQRSKAFKIEVVKQAAGVVTKGIAAATLVIGGVATAMGAIENGQVNTRRVIDGNASIKDNDGEESSTTRKRRD